MVIRPSLRLALLLLSFHLMAASVVCVTDMPATARGGVLLMILLSLLYSLARDVALWLPDSWCEIVLEQEGMLVVNRKGEAIHGSVVNKTVVSPFFILLHIRFEGRRIAVSRVIFPDALNVGLFRELCVHLKFAVQFV